MCWSRHGATFWTLVDKTAEGGANATAVVDKVDAIMETIATDFILNEVLRLYYCWVLRAGEFMKVKEWNAFSFGNTGPLVRLGRRRGLCVSIVACCDGGGGRQQRQHEKGRYPSIHRGKWWLLTDVFAYVTQYSDTYGNSHRKMYVYTYRHIWYRTCICT